MNAETAPGITRRDLLAAAALTHWGCSRTTVQATRPASPVSILKASSYSADLLSILTQGAQQCGLEVRGQRVLIKPNLVEFDYHTCINTNPVLIQAAYEMLRRLGASEVLIGEGPGHRRDTLALAEEAGYFSTVSRFEQRFIDLNRDDVAPAPGFLEDQKEIYLPKTALAADLIVSMPKMKTHHWAGATLSMKNYFGLVPGGVYGWPKNPLHYVGIDKSIVELNRIFRRNFAIVDGIVGMEGNGPIQGTPKHAGVIVMGPDLVAVDATCCRIMSIEPARIHYLESAAGLGNLKAERIDLRGETLGAVRQTFQLIQTFAHLRLS